MSIAALASHAAPIVHAPRDADAAQAVLAAAHESGDALRIAGAGSWLHAGAPVHAAAALRLDALRGVVDYEPGDLVITARAGTTLAELEAITAAHGQWLALDPVAHPTATLGATIATASAGPLAHAVGTPRDLVLGLRVIDGRGTALHVGGRVVKNVAGFDLVRLFTGSHGTLGAIVEATVRLRARPAVETTLALGVTPATLADVARALRAPVLAPLACEYVGAALATRLGLAARACVLVRIGGNAPFVRAQREAVASLAPATELPVATWSALQAIALDAPVSYRVTGPVRDIAARVAAEEGRDWHGAEALVQASLGRGLVRVTVPVVAGDMRAPAIARADDRLHLDCAPHAWWATWPDPFATPLARRVRDAFDPRRVCNRTDVPLVGTPHG